MSIEDLFFDGHYFWCPLWRGNINRGKKKALAKESERGIVELETLKRVNDNLIQTIEETIKIQQEGHSARQAAEAEIAGIEDKLKQSLLTVRDSGQRANPSAGY